MSTAMLANDILFSDSKNSPAPYQDFHQLLVSKNEVIFRTWKVTPRKVKATPSETKIPFLDFPDCNETKNDIKRVFGVNVLDYVSNLAKGQIDYLPRMPEKILLRILSHLDLGDFINMSKTSNLFHKLCKDETLWERLFYKHHKMSPCPELKELAATTTWKHLTFCNMLQLRVQMLKHLKLKEGLDGGDGDIQTEEKNNFSATSLKRTTATTQQSSSSAGAGDRKTSSGNLNVSNSGRFESTELFKSLKSLNKKTSSSSSSSSSYSSAQLTQKAASRMIGRTSGKSPEEKGHKELMADTDRFLLMSSRSGLDEKWPSKKKKDEEGCKRSNAAAVKQEDSINFY